MNASVDKSSDALKRAIEHHRQDNASEAESGYRAIDPDDPTYPLAQVNLAVLLKAQGKPRSALEILKKIIQDPECPMPGHLNLGQLLLEQGQPQLAERTFAHAITQWDDQAVLWYGLGCAQRDQHKPQEAKRTFQKTARLKPGWLDVSLDLANVCRQLGQQGEANQLYTGVLAEETNNWKAHYGLARLHDDAGENNRFRYHFQKALDLCPDSVELMGLMAMTRMDDGRYKDALVLLRDALKADPKRLKLGIPLSNCLIRVGRGREAAPIIHKLTQSQDRVLLRQVAVLYQKMGQHDEALALLEKLVESDPDDDALQLHLCQCQLHSGQLSTASEVIDKARKHPENLPAWAMLQGELALLRGDSETAFALYYTLFEQDKLQEDAQLSKLAMISLYDDQLSDEEVARIHRVVAQRIEQNNHPCQSAPMLPSTALEGPLRVGYLLHREQSHHSILRFLTGLLQHQDKQLIHSYVYYTDPLHDEDIIAAKELAYRWRDVDGWNNQRLAAHMRKDGLHLLCDLQGHRDGNPLGVMALRPAPVQISLAGAPYATGLRSMDAIVVDEINYHDGKHIQETLRLPRSHFCFHPLTEQHPPPRSLSSEQRISFGALHEVKTLSSTTINLWIKLLQAIPQGRLVLMAKGFADESVRQSFQRRFADQGIGPDRLLLENALGRAENLRIYEQIDIALDPTPYNGTQTTFDALCMGVPVITLTGDRMVSKTGTSLLSAVGLDEWIAGSEEEYLAIATRWANQRDELLALKQQLRGRVEASPLCDWAGYSKALEQSLRNQLAQNATTITRDELESFGPQRSGKGRTFVLLLATLLVVLGTMHYGKLIPLLPDFSKLTQPSGPAIEAPPPQVEREPEPVPSQKPEEREELRTTPPGGEEALLYEEAQLIAPPAIVKPEGAEMTPQAEPQGQASRQTAPVVEKSVVEAPKVEAPAPTKAPQISGERVAIAAQQGAQQGAQKGAQKGAQQAPALAQSTTRAEATEAAAQAEATTPGRRATTEQAPSAPAPQAAAEPPLREPDRERLKQLLAQAKANLQARQLTWPPENNAFDKLNEVLKLQPGHPEALAGMEQMASRYQFLCREQIESGNRKKGLALCNKAKKLRSSFGLPQQPAAQEVAAIQPLSPEILRLLAEGDEKLRRDRLMWPKHDSAYSRYLNVLKLDADNSRALLGLKRISDRYADLCERDLKANKHKKARTFCGKAEEIVQKHGQGDLARIRSLQKRLPPPQ
uniref:protein O-GlcNAc transferase n=1 Tax=Magnetococcus massalia (strain MO-1) TaxID=451514 RepID=A0A1S7LIG1_MAGMO|nr:putative GT41 : distantly related to UDP-GlcNAc: protein O-b-N-acetylglucosaminyltransferase [Candidatus Magnetococcus massalia]